jgi:hypothetical protein
MSTVFARVNPEPGPPPPVIVGARGGPPPPTIVGAAAPGMVFARIAPARGAGPPAPVIVDDDEEGPPPPRVVGAAAPRTVFARVATSARALRPAARASAAGRARIRLRWKLPGQVFPLGLGQTCDPATMSCPPESQASAVRADMPAEWLTTFRRPSADEIDEASADASTWETFVQGYTARAGMAFARLRANLTNYLQLAQQQQKDLVQQLRDHPNATPDTRMTVYTAIQDYTIAISEIMQNLAWLNAVAAGQAIIGFDLLHWKFAYLPRGELPADAPAPISLAPEGIGVAPVVIIVVVSVVSMFVAGAVIAYWSGEREKAEPAIQDAKGRLALSNAQARRMDAMTMLANDQAAAGRPDVAAAILRMAGETYVQDLNALTQPDWARTAAARAAAETGFGGIGEAIKWGLIALFGLKALEHLK